MIIVNRWLRLSGSYCLLAIFIISTVNYRTCIYLFYQGSGQLHILMNTETLEQYATRSNAEICEKLKMIEQVKRYSIDSLGYKATKNFTTIYDQKNLAVLWVLTVSEPFALKAYEWKFPLIGNVSYKGFFKKDLAVKAAAHFRSVGYDADIRTVSAWSTLGWFKDPILSNTLNRDKGNLCELFFHELFHATYFAPNSVDFNENIATFVAHKATLLFLEKDQDELSRYIKSCNDNVVYRNFMLRQSDVLKEYYRKIENDPLRSVLKLRIIKKIADSLDVLQGMESRHINARRNRMFTCKNAYFIDFEQYDSMQDSLEEVFNKFYKGSLKKMVQDLKQKAGNY